MAAGSVTETPYEIGNIRKIRFEGVANSSDGLLAAHTVTKKFEGRLIQLVTDPDETTPPDNLYDLTITNGLGADVLCGVGANRSSTDAELAAVVFSGTSVHPVVKESDTLILNFSGSTKNSAEFTADLYYALGG